MKIKGVNKVNHKEGNQKGFTMIELVGAVLLMGIMGSLIIPAFGNMVVKSKISTDVSTVKTVKRLIDAYNAEGNIPAMTSGDSVTTIGENLFDAGYLESATINLQTKGKLEYTAATTLSASTLRLDVSGMDGNLVNLANKMIASDSDNENWIKTSE